MVLDVEDSWVWDFWTCREDDRTHLFFLHAPRSLGDPDERHFAASVGHAVSTDLVTWDRLPDALAPQQEPAFDDLACWTGCVVRGPDRWWMFTSGVGRARRVAEQRIGSAWSTDLLTWTRTDLVLGPDPRWYDVDPALGDPHWRDPWVVAGPDGRWHMLVTAKAGGARHGGGVVGHAVSDDLVGWEVRPPLSAPTGRFDHLEVVSLVEVGGRWVLVFSCLGRELPGVGPGGGGVWSVPGAPPGRPLEVAAAVRLTDESSYVGKVVPAPDGEPVLLAFRNTGPDGRFVGGVADPVGVRWRADGLGLETEGRLRATPG